MKNLLALILFLLVFISSSPCSSSTYFVSPLGEDSNPGSEELPWKTPAIAVKKLKPGDYLIFKSGTYILQDFEDIITPPSGTEEQPIVLMGEYGKRAVLAGRNNLLTAINLSGAKYVILKNLEITHDSNAKGDSVWFRDGIEILSEASSHIILENLYIHHIDEFGINIQDVEDLQIINCTIEYCGFGSIGGPLGNSGGWRNVLISSSRLAWSGHYYQGGDGSNRPYDRPDGLGVEASSGPITIINTISEHNYGDGLDSKAENTIIRNCIVANNSCDGVKLWGDGSKIENTLIYGRGDGDLQPTPWAAIVIDQGTKSGARFEITNVTVDDYVGKNYLMYVQYDSKIPIVLVIKNSIFSERGPNSPIYIHPASQVIMDHNIFYMPQNSFVISRGELTYTCQELSSLGANNQCSDPKFDNVSSENYHLRDDSPAIDAGNNQAVPSELTKDLDGKPRFFDMPLITDTGTGNPPIVDIGAYENQVEPHIQVDIYPLQEEETPDTLKVNVSLENKGVSFDADWWFAAQTPFGLFFLTPNGWTNQWNPIYQGRLQEIKDLELFSIPTKNLPPGQYLLYFGIDMTKDGQINWDSLNYTVTSFSISQ